MINTIKNLKHKIFNVLVEGVYGIYTTITTPTLSFGFTLKVSL